MHKVLLTIAAAAFVIAIIDLQAPAGSPSVAEGGILLILTAALLVAGGIAWARGTRKCPRCAERIKRAATVCRHCGNDKL